MTAHVHDFQPFGPTYLGEMGTKLSRLRCACGVLGRFKGMRKVPILCQAVVEDRKHCGADAVYADGNRQRSRCAAHPVPAVRVTKAA